MKIKWLVGALIVLVVLNLAALGAFLFASFHRDDWRGPRGARPPFMAGHSPEDRRTLFRAMRSLHDQIGPLVEQTDRLETELIASMGKDPVPQARIDSLLSEISSKRLEIARKATHHMIALGDSLSAEEREHMMNMLVRMHGPGGPGGQIGRAHV